MLKIQATQLWLAVQLLSNFKCRLFALPCCCGSHRLSGLCSVDHVAPLNPPNFQKVKSNRLVSFFPPFSIWLFHLCCRPSGTFVIPSCSGIPENQFLPWQIPFSGGSKDQRRRGQIDALWFALFELCRRNTVLSAPVFIYAVWVAGLRCSEP